MLLGSLEALCHKSPAQTKNSKVRGMGRKRAILGWTRRRVLNIEERNKIRWDHMT